MLIVLVTDIWYVVSVLRNNSSKLTKILRALKNVVFGNVCLTKKVFLQCVRDFKIWNLVANIYMFIVLITDVWYVVWILRKKISNLTKILRAHENVVFGNVWLTIKALLQCVRDFKFWGLVVKLYIFMVVKTNFWYEVWVLRKKILNFDKIDSWKNDFLQNWHYLLDRKSISVLLDKLQT